MLITCFKKPFTNPMIRNNKNIARIIILTIFSEYNYRPGRQYLNYE